MLVEFAGEVYGRGADGERGVAGCGLGAGGNASPVERSDVFVSVAVSGPVVCRIAAVPVRVAGTVVVAIGVVAYERAGLCPGAGAVGGSCLIGAEAEDDVSACAVGQTDGVRVVIVGLGAESAPR